MSRFPRTPVAVEEVEEKVGTGTETEAMEEIGDVAKEEAETRSGHTKKNPREDAAMVGRAKRTEERRVGKERVSTCRYRCSQYHKKKKNTEERQEKNTQ